MAVKPARPTAIDPGRSMPDSYNGNEASIDADAMPPLMPGEAFRLPPIMNVQYRDHRSYNLKPGKLLLTNYRFLWISEQVQVVPHERVILDMPLTAVFKIDKPGSSQTKTPESSCLLAVQGKDMQLFTFVFPGSCYIHSGAPQPDGAEQNARHDSPRRLFYDKLRELAFININVKDAFAYSFYKTQPNYPGVSQNGWDVYNPKEEFKRLGVAVDGSVGGGRVSLAAKNDGTAVNATWRLTMINDKHKVAETYPAVLCVPASADDDLLRNAADFRTKRRLPVLSWLHPITGASITRSSQPMTGISNRRNVYDERYLKMILDTNPHSAKLMIVDARPQVNAIANRGKGGGYESEENYQDIEFQFFDVDNIHVMRESLRKLCDICSPRTLDDVGGISSTQKEQNSSSSVGTWRAQVEQTKWLEHVKSTIAGALRVVDFVNNQHYSVLVHCSDGWDRTAQITSLAQVMMDPYYRTVNGFAVLVEKEWISMGHRFALRIGVGEEKLQERSPIFLQFIDAVWQLTEQFPRAFEFNERFLIFLLDQLYSGVFGTFLFNSELELLEAGAKRHTHSIWTHVWYEIDNFLNPAYCVPTTCDDIIEPITSLRFIKLWTNYYCRWDPNLNIAFADGGIADAAAQQKELIAVKNWLEREVQRLRLESKATKTPANGTPVIAGRPSESSGTDADEVDKYKSKTEQAPPKAAQKFKASSNVDYGERRPSQLAENAITRSAGGRTNVENPRTVLGSSTVDNTVLSSGSAPSNRRTGKHVAATHSEDADTEIPYENL